MTSAVSIYEVEKACRDTLNIILYKIFSKRIGMKTDKISISKTNMGFPHEGKIYTIGLPHKNPYSLSSRERRIITGSLDSIKDYLREEFEKSPESKPRLMMFWGIPRKERLPWNYRREIRKYIRELTAI